MNKPLKLQNRLDDILWSLDMIKRQSASDRGCVLKDTGGFIRDGQIDDLIDMIKELEKHETKFTAKQNNVSNKSENQRNLMNIGAKNQ